MEALVLSGQDKEFSYKTDVPIPEITTPEDILIKVAYSGMCGVDLHTIKGEFPSIKKPLILGHEFGGIVADIGENVKHFEKGDRVVVDPNGGCGRCRWCRLGSPHQCEEGMTSVVGLFVDGGLAQYVVVPESKTHQLPETIPLELAVVAEPISCITHAWDRLVPTPTLGTKIMINGAGIMGILWAAFLHLQGQRDVTIREANNISRLENFKNLDLEYTLITPDEEKSITNFFDLIIECTGNPSDIEAVYPFVNFGGTLMIFGCTPTISKVTLPFFDIYCKEMKIVGTKFNQFAYPKGLGLMESMIGRYLDYEKLNIRVFELKDYEEAMAQLTDKKISKVVFKIDDGEQKCVCKPPRQCEKTSC